MNNQLTLLQWERMYKDIIEDTHYTGIECVVGYRDVLPSLIEYLQYDENSMFASKEYVDTLLDYYRNPEQDIYTVFVRSQMLEEIKENSRVSMLHNGTFDLKGNDEFKYCMKREIEYSNIEQTNMFSTICQQKDIHFEVLEFDTKEVILEIHKGEDTYTFTYEDRVMFEKEVSEDIWDTVFNTEGSIVHAGFSIDMIYLLLAKGILYEQDLETVDINLSWNDYKIQCEFNLYQACKHYRDTRNQWLDAVGIEYFSDWAIRI